MDRLYVSVLCVCVCVCVCTKSNYLILHSIGYLEYGMETLQRDRPPIWYGNIAEG